MTESKLSHAQLELFREFVTRVMGLHFAPARWPDLERGLLAAAAEAGRGTSEDAVAWMHSLMREFQNEGGGAAGVESLALHLTVGETYFFRDEKSLEALALDILPALMRTKRNQERRLRIWSAACCTGEEPYSIAILLQRTIPDWRDWNITLLATDINPRFLRKAAEGVYGAWSFRSAPPWLKDHYFRAAPGGQFKVRPEVRQMVQFMPMNLVDDAYPSPFNNTSEIDILFCRNALMYFSAEQATKVVAKFRRAQAEDGWLVLGANELSYATAAGYSTLELRGTNVHQNSAKAAATLRSETKWMSPAPFAAPLPLPATASPIVHEQRRAAPPPEAILAADRTDTVDYAPKARSLANEGRLDDALACCEQWVLADKGDFSAHYLRALILLEKRGIDEAVASLRRALYLSPKFVMAHYALGNIARERGQAREADRHMKNVMELLRDRRPDEIVPESGGVTVERFAQIVTSLISVEAGS